MSAGHKTEDLTDTGIRVRCASGMVHQVPRGDEPQVRLHLQPGERVMNFTWSRPVVSSHRKTIDWGWSATIIRDGPR